jgi:hypothetical protein
MVNRHRYPDRGGARQVGVAIGQQILPAAPLPDLTVSDSDLSSTNVEGLNHAYRLLSQQRDDLWDDVHDDDNAETARHAIRAEIAELDTELQRLRRLIAAHARIAR